MPGTILVTSQFVRFTDKEKSEAKCGLMGTLLEKESARLWHSIHKQCDSGQVANLFHNSVIGQHHSEHLENAFGPTENPFYL